MEGLKAISQVHVNDAWHKVHFSAANNRGIHGGTPSEMLHAILLGIFAYDRNVFVNQLGGEQAALRKDVLALAQQCAVLFQHQSEKDLPRLNKSKGIADCRIAAKEF